MSSIANIKHGAPKVTFKGVELGWTKGGLSIKMNQKKIPISVDQLGEVILDMLLAGKEIIISIPLAETGLMSLMNYIIADGRAVDISGLYYQLAQGVGIDSYINGGLLKIERMTSESATEGGDESCSYYLYTAIPMGPLEFKRELKDDAEIITINFNCVPASYDTGTGTGGALTLTDATKLWAVNQFRDFILVDVNGVEYVIASNTGTALTTYTGSPASGIYEIKMHNKRDAGGGIGTLNTWTDTDKVWTTNEWIGYALTDSDGDIFRITANGANTLTIVGTPTTGDYTIGVVYGKPKYGHRGKV